MEKTLEILLQINKIAAAEYTKVYFLFTKWKIPQSRWRNQIPYVSWKSLTLHDLVQAHCGKTQFFVQLIKGLKCEFFAFLESKSGFYSQNFKYFKFLQSEKVSVLARKFKLVS